MIYIGVGKVEKTPEKAKNLKQTIHEILTLTHTIMMLLSTDKWLYTSDIYMDTLSYETS